MSDAKKNETARQGKSAAAIDALDASEQGSSAAAPKPKPKPKPKEKKGVGTDNTNANAKARAAQLAAKIKAARGAGNNSLADRLAAQRAKLLAEIGEGQ